jgi:hypothetical protein
MIYDKACYRQLVCRIRFRRAVKVRDRRGKSRPCDRQELGSPQVVVAKAICGLKRQRRVAVL